LTTDAKGQIKVDDLKPGDYYFVETAAPAGYELNDSQLSFMVECKQPPKLRPFQLRTPKRPVPLS
jgi:uncharacterized surface anchored protein